MARPKGSTSEKSFANMLRVAISEAQTEGGPTALREVAQALVDKGKAGDVSAIKEIADRLDGKVPQAIVGDDRHDPIRTVSEIESRIVDPKPTGRLGS